MKGPSSSNPEDCDAAAALWREGLSPKAIAARLGWSPGQTSGLIHRARLNGDTRFPSRPSRIGLRVPAKPNLWTEERLAAIRTWRGTPRACHAAVGAMPGDAVTYNMFRHKWRDMHGRKGPPPGKHTLPAPSETILTATPPPVPTVARFPMMPVRSVSAAPATEFAVRWLPPKARECQWPIGTPGRPDFRFCCAKTAVTWKSWSYCEDHCREAYANWASVRDAKRAA